MIPCMPTLTQIRQQLASNPVHESPDTLRAAGGKFRDAAVAVILKGEDNPEVLFIERARHEGDPWSGQMAFPGGKREETDASLMDTAMRETVEEIGLDLVTLGQPIGALPHQQAAPGGRPIGLSVWPYVFVLDQTPTFSMNREVADVVWTPLDNMVSGVNHTESDQLATSGFGTWPGYRLERGHFVWGLTYRMLHTFFGIIQPGWTSPD